LLKNGPGDESQGGAAGEAGWKTPVTRTHSCWFWCTQCAKGYGGWIWGVYPKAASGKSAGIL